MVAQGRRSENTFVDVASAQSDAQNLLQAGNFIIYKYKSEVFTTSV